MQHAVFRRRLPLLLAAAVVLGVASLWHFEPRVGQLWLNTAALAVGACLIALPLGGIAAVMIYKTDTPGRRAAGLLFTGMLFVPLYLVAGAWDAGFGLQGWHTLANPSVTGYEPWLSGWRAAVWVHGLAAVPWVVVIVGAALRAVEAEIEQDAATCATPTQVLWHVSLRRAAPAFVVAGLWVAVTATAEISATDFFQVRTFAEEVYTQAALGAFDTGLGPALSASGLWIGLLSSTAIAVAAIAIIGRLFTDFPDSPQRAPWTAHFGRRRWLAVAFLCAIMFLVAGLPLGNLMYKAGMHGELTDAGPVRSWSAAKVAARVVAAPIEFRRDLLLSVQVGAAASTAALAVAIPLAWSMRFAGGVPWLRLAFLALCLTIPGPLLGIGLIHVLNRPPDSPLSMLAWLYDTNFAVWLAQTIRAVPLATLVLWPALASVPQAMLDTAATEGSGWWGRLLRIALPQRGPAAAAAWLVGLAIAVGELAATVLVVRPIPGGTTAISVRIFQLLHYGVDDRVAAISLVMVAGIAAITGIAATLLSRRKWET